MDGLAGLLRENAGDPDPINAIADRLDSQTDNLAGGRSELAEAIARKPMPGGEPTVPPALEPAKRG